MTTSRSTLIVAVSIGIAIGACVHEAVQVVAPRNASAQDVAPKKIYAVVGASNRASGYESDLNEYTAVGWRFVSTVKPPGANEGHCLIFERSDGKNDRP